MDHIRIILQVISECNKIPSQLKTIQTQGIIANFSDQLQMNGKKVTVALLQLTERKKLKVIIIEKKNPIRKPEGLVH